MRPYILAESNWKMIKDQDFEIAVLPWGATEAHNLHLPYSIDNIEGEKITGEAARIAWEKGIKIIILPCIPFGVNTGQSDIKLDINMNPSTQFAILKDILEVLNRQGIKKLVIANSHGGNDFKSMIREAGLLFPDMFLCSCNWYQIGNKMDFFENPGDHADEAETSLLMYLRPDLVLPLSEAGDGVEKKNKISAFREGWAWTERKWSKVTKDTGVGNPKKATTEKGKKYFEMITREMASFFIDLAKTNRDDMYQ